MGHTRLGKIPKSQKWTSVVELFLGKDVTLKSIESDLLLKDIAKRTLEAAEQALNSAAHDAGFRYICYNLLLLSLVAKTKDWEPRLEALGINKEDVNSPRDLYSQIQYKIEDHIDNNKFKSDLTQIAQISFAEVSRQYLLQGQSFLIDSPKKDVYESLKNISSKRVFGEISQKFFGSFLARFLNFYLSRITTRCLGKSFIGSAFDINTFNDTLKKHCTESAFVINDFSASWRDKTNFKTGIDLNNISEYTETIVSKLKKEIKHQRGEND